MFDNIETRARNLKAKKPSAFQGGELQRFEVPDNHSVAIVSSHLGLPLCDVTPGSYEVYDTKPQVNSEPIERYQKAISDLVTSL